MHALVRWIDCEDPTCKCNLYLARQTPITLVKGSPGRPIVPIEHRKHPSITAYVEGCHCVECRKFNAQRVASHRARKKTL